MEALYPWLLLWATVGGSMILLAVTDSVDAASLFSRRK